LFCVRISLYIHNLFFLSVSVPVSFDDKRSDILNILHCIPLLLNWRGVV